MADPMVVDASAWLAVLLEEERSTHLKNILQDHPLLAPDLIRYETANGLLFAHRRGRMRLQKSSLKELFDLVGDFPIQEIPMTTWWKEAIRLVQCHNITFYDAAYLGVSLSLKVPLLTMDVKILRIMKIEGLETLH